MRHGGKVVHKMDTPFYMAAIPISIQSLFHILIQGPRKNLSTNILYFIHLKEGFIFR